MNTLSQQTEQFRLNGNNCWKAQLSKTEIRKNRTSDLPKSVKEIKYLIKIFPERIFQRRNEGVGITGI